MKIKTERLTLVPISEAFLDSACAYAMNADNARLMVYLPKEDRDEVREYTFRRKIATRSENFSAAPGASGRSLSPTYASSRFCATESISAA